MNARPHLALTEAVRRGPAHTNILFDHDWTFLGKAATPAAPISITLPHCPVKLSWQEWNAELWEKVWLYRKSFARPAASSGLRTFLKFDGGMVTIDVTVNGAALPQHKGGYLPFTGEITSLLQDSNVVEVRVDARFQNVPPEGSPKGRSSIDYYVPGGLIRGATLYTVPHSYIRDVFVKPVDVLLPTRRAEILCTIDSSVALDGPAHVTALLVEGSRVVSRSHQVVPHVNVGDNEVHLTLQNLNEVKLWNNDNPHLYQVHVSLELGGKSVHVYRTRVGFREAKFAVDGFFLNGKKMQFFGLDRHELYPYTGYAMPERVMRKDAEIIRREFNCNMVRCSHYPQHEAFLDACDELGLMVWEETPGWQYIGDQQFQDQVVENVHDMILRDRNHPSIIVWGVRINESHNDPPLYDRTYAAAKQLDDSRPTSGSMTGFGDWKTKWHEDVFAFDDYHQSPDGTVQVLPPLPGIPYMLAETVGQRTYTAPGFHNMYRRAAEPSMQYHQAIYHAQAHDRARAYDRMCGVIAWCAFEYGSPQNSYKGVKNPGVADVFRIPKLGASFYQAQVSPHVRPVIEPNFYWDFGPMTPNGPGKGLAIFHNCDHLQVFVGGKLHASLEPDRAGYPHLLYPPSWIDLEMDGSQHPELQIDGYVGAQNVLTRRFSSDPSKDIFVAKADDDQILGDGIDAVRIVFRIADQYGAQRLLGQGQVTIDVTGPGELIGDQIFSLSDSGGAGAVWVKSLPKAGGDIHVRLTHATKGFRSVTIRARQRPA